MGKIQKLHVCTGIVICFIILYNLSFIYYDGQCAASEENILWVDDEFPYPKESTGSLEQPYKYISSAIAAASDGDSIYVLSGTYREDIIINKSISIISENVNTTIIDSFARNAYMIDITADSVSLEGFTLRSVTDSSHRRVIVHISENADDVLVTDNIMRNITNILGIKIDGADRAIIRNNSINDTKGIQIQNSNDNYIYNNTIWNCTGGAVLRLISSNSNIIENNIFNNSFQGIYAKDVSDTTFRYNKIRKNDVYGLAIISGTNNIILNNTINTSNIGIKIGSSTNEIIGNNISNNSIGISLDGSSCIVKDNLVRDSSTYGIYASAASDGNIIFNNNITATSFYYLGKDDGDNQWDDGVIGNYWTDYYGPDNDDDGRGEVTYTRGGVYDRYPKGVFNQLPRIMNNSPTHLANGTDIRPTLSVKVVDPEDHRMDVYFYYVLNSTSYLINVVNNVESNGTAGIPFYSTVEGKNAVYSYPGHGYDYICVWYVVVEDQYSSNKSSEWIFTTKQVPIDNEKPYADAGGPYEGSIGELILFDGSGCNDSDGDVEFYRWNFGDGNSQTNTIYPQHSYANPGIYSVRLTIIDNGGRWNMATTTTTVSAFSPPNVSPTADIGGPYSINDAGEITFDASNSLDTDGVITNYTWDFGDGSIGYSSLVVHNYTENGTYTVVLTVTDDDDDSDTISTTVNVGPSSSLSEETQVFKIDYMLLVFIAVAIIICIVVGVLFWRYRME